MLSADGCRARRQRLWDALSATARVPALVLTDPIHLRYLANFHVDPFSLGADFGGLLVIRPDGHATVYHDRRLPESVQSAHVDQREIVPWYDGQTPGQGPRRLAIRGALEANGGRIHDSLADPLGPTLIETIATMRRRKDPDEIAILQACMRATEAGHAWARANIRAGMSELDVYEGVFTACCSTAGKPVIVYGDFAVSPGSARRGGPPTNLRLKDGNTFILDYSVVLFGYRSDFTNTLVVGGNPTAEQMRIFDACVAAMSAGEGQLKAGAACQTVYDAVRGSLAAAGLADYFPHHAGHGLGLAHPEAPFIVRQSSETLFEGDVVTLEPGVYVDGIGGVRIEHNYRITATGYERMSQHVIALTRVDVATVR
jgi:Xaa-Pro dipeptidase